MQAPILFELFSVTKSVTLRFRLKSRLTVDNMADGFLVLRDILEWLARSFWDLPDDKMDGSGSSQDCRLAIRLTSCCRGFPEVLQIMRLRLIEGRLRYAQIVVTEAINNRIYPMIAWVRFDPLENTPRKYMTEEQWQSMRAIEQRQIAYEDLFAAENPRIARMNEEQDQFNEEERRFQEFLSDSY